MIDGRLAPPNPRHAPVSWATLTRAFHVFVLALGAPVVPDVNATTTGWSNGMAGIMKRDATDAEPRAK